MHHFFFSGVPQFERLRHVLLNPMLFCLGGGGEWRKNKTATTPDEKAHMTLGTQRGSRKKKCFYFYFIFFDDVGLTPFTTGNLFGDTFA